MVKYILAETIGKVEIGADGYPTGSLRPEKVPDMRVGFNQRFKRYSPDQTNVLIECDDDTIDVKQYGDDVKELTALEAKALYEQWQNEWDLKCNCFGKNHTHATHPELNRPCLAGNLGGICHEIIDNSKQKDTIEFDKWKIEFDKKAKKDFTEEAEKRARKRKENEILDIATKTKADPMTTANALKTITVAPQEIDTEISEIVKEEIEEHKYRLIKHPLMKVKVAF